MTRPRLKALLAAVRQQGLDLPARIRRRLGQADGLVWVGNFGSIGLRFLLSILIARFAGPESMGIYVAVFAIAIVLSRLSDLGLPQALIHFMRLEPGGRRRCLSIAIAQGVFAVPLLALCSFLLGGILPVAPEAAAILRDSAWIVALLGITTLLASVTSQLLIPLEAYLPYGISVLAAPVVSILALLQLGPGVSVLELIALTTLAEGIGALVALIASFRLLRTPDTTSPPDYSEIVSYALKTYAGTSLKVLAQRGDRIILAGLAPSASLAAFAIASSLRDNAQLPATTHAMLLRNRLIDALKADGGSALAWRLFRADLLRWAIYGSLIGACLAAAAPVLVPLVYGPGFESAALMLVLLSASLPAVTVTLLAWTAFLAAGHALQWSMGLIISGAANLAAVYAGALIYGAEGAAAALSLVAWLFVPVWVFAAHRALNSPASVASEFEPPSASTT